MYSMSTSVYWDTSTGPAPPPPYGLLPQISNLGWQRQDLLGEELEHSPEHGLVGQESGGSLPGHYPRLGVLGFSPPTTGASTGRGDAVSGVAVYAC